MFAKKENVILIFLHMFPEVSSKQNEYGATAMNMIDILLGERTDLRTKCKNEEIDLQNMVFIKFKIRFEALYFQENNVMIMPDNSKSGVQMMFAARILANISFFSRFAEINSRGSFAIIQVYLGNGTRFGIKHLSFAYYIDAQCSANGRCRPLSHCRWNRIADRM